MKRHDIASVKKISPVTGFFKIAILAISTFFSVSIASAQAVSGIITDFNSYWKSSASNINPVKPNNSHNLLAFTYNGTTYSTGANDLLLTSHGENFTPGDFWSLSFDGITGKITGNTKVGLGEMKDLVHNGPSNPPPAFSISAYLGDGIKGLDLGTGIANLPAGQIRFNVNTIKPQNIGDGIPDVLITQIADPSGSTDSYSFVNAAGVIVGNKKDITFTNITPVGNWTADFYEASASPMTLAGGFTNTDRSLRLWAADLSEFGITAANYQSISKFIINLSGQSDVAFVAYNNETFSISSLLPVKLIDFSGKLVNNNTQLTWTTATEENSKTFTIEKSTDNHSFAAIGTINAAGNTTTVQYYSFTDKNMIEGVNYYRLKTTDIDGSFEYSKTIQVQVIRANTTASLYPNPCKSSLTINHPVAREAQLLVYNVSGIAVKKTVVAGNARQTTMNVQNMDKGMYYAVWQNGSEKITMPFMVN